jgi:hypothetical protein
LTHFAMLQNLNPFSALQDPFSHTKYLMSLVHLLFVEDCPRILKLLKANLGTFAIIE